MCSLPCTVSQQNSVQNALMHYLCVSCALSQLALYGQFGVAADFVVSSSAGASATFEAQLVPEVPIPGLAFKAGPIGINLGFFIGLQVRMQSDVDRRLGLKHGTWCDVSPVRSVLLRIKALPKTLHR